MPITYVKAEKITDAAKVKNLYKPTHPGLFEVVYAEGDYNSKLIACRDYSQGSIICLVEGVTFTAPGTKTYTSVQVANNEHIELNSDLVFMNHSCNPSVNLDIDTMTAVAALDIKKGVPYFVLNVTSGDNMTFFYPASEWEMTQPFPCWCNAEQCIKDVKGAKFLSKEIVARYFVTKHIRMLLDERERTA
ncbi:hypothetical protein BGX28_010077 [Mortierella sp. GBA30]|nr:hypothetical protein BGX28_010077 [Mortierella sp. GBA30]